MSEITAQTVYFAQPGRQNTARVLELVRARAEALEIETILVATTSGATAVQAGEALSGYRVIAVTHSAGFRGPNTQDLEPEQRAAAEALGVELLTCQHAFGGVNRAIRRKLDTYQVDEIIANVFRLFGQGMKVVAEITLMAADAGLVRVDVPVLVVAGSGHGADTAVVLQPANAHEFFNLKFMEILCLPSPAHPAFAE